MFLGMSTNSSGKEVNRTIRRQRLHSMSSAVSPSLHSCSARVIRSGVQEGRTYTPESPFSVERVLGTGAIYLIITVKVNVRAGSAPCSQGRQYSTDMVLMSDLPSTFIEFDSKRLRKCMLHHRPVLSRRGGSSHPGPSCCLT